jgi:hypothetical protein
MTIVKLVELEIDLQTLNGDLNRGIESLLTEFGSPLRWSIASIDPRTKLARIEAIVTIGS